MGTERGQRITFSPEQQARVDQLMNQAFAKGRRKGLAEASAEIERLKARIAELETPKKKYFLPWRRK